MDIIIDGKTLAEYIDARIEAALGEEKPSGPSVQDATEAAKAAMDAGEREKVKAALAKVGAKRVSTITSSQVAQFMEALNEGN